MQSKTHIWHKRLWRAGAGLLLALGLGANAHAAFPDRAISMVVPYPPGGTTDIAARTIAHAMEKVLGQAVVVENRPGAGGNIGMAYLAKARPDGYTIAMGTIGTQSINEFLYQDMHFDPGKDFEPLAMVLTTPNVIIVRNDSEIHTMKDLVAAAKAAKVELSYATPGIGSSVHLTGAYIEQFAGIDMLHVPYKGVAESMPGLISGQVDILLDNLPSSLAQLRDGSRVRAIAVTSAERSPALPDVPAVAEDGSEPMDVVAWFATYAPAGIPADAREALIDASRKALASPEVQESFISLGAEAGTIFGDDLRAFEASERERWSQLIKQREIPMR
ncbi:MAG: tripartite tricarboxylate transporter substrate binding protein [Castellaniella sp.]